MTDIMTHDAITDVKHFIIDVDPETGEEIRIPVEATGEFSQDAEDDNDGLASPYLVTLH
jgi:hypothetical protein